MRILITEKLSDAGLDLLRERFQVDVREDLAHGDLTSAIAPYDALVIRSATRVTAEVLEAAPRLKVVARAGIGVDNVDVEAATRRGVMVVNAPRSNTISAAEHTMALLLAQGFGMRVIAFDPYVSGERAAELGVDVMPTLESLLVQSDFVSIHLPGSPETHGLIGEHQLAMVKHGARLVNTSRGGIVDEEALAKALDDGRLAGAALDVFAVEPAIASPLFGMDQVVVTPHLGASTVEAQDKAGVTVAEMVRLALEGQFVPYAVNVSAGAEVSEAVRPFVGLAERLGALVAGLADGGVRSIVASYLGRVAEHDTRVLTLAMLKGILGRSVNEPVSFVNAPLLARDRGLTVSEMRSTGSQDYVSQIAVRAETESESEIEVAGTLLGKKNAERVIQVWDFEVEIEPAPHMLFFVYEDRPGIIGKVGTILGEHGINIATMEVGRKAAGGDALMGLTVDSPVPPDVLQTIADAISAHTIRAVTLDA